MAHKNNVSNNQLRTIRSLKNDRRGQELYRHGRRRGAAEGSKSLAADWVRQVFTFCLPDRGCHGCRRRRVVGAMLEDGMRTRLKHGNELLSFPLQNISSRPSRHDGP